MIFVYIGCSDTAFYVMFGVKIKSGLYWLLLIWSNIFQPWIETGNIYLLSELTYLSRDSSSIVFESVTYVAV